MKYTAQKEQITLWLAKLAEKYTLLAPTTKASSVSFQPYTKAEVEKAVIDELLDYTTTSPKKAYIPETETLFNYTSTKHEEDLSKVDTSLKVAYNEEYKIIFGSRPCDAKGVLVQDAAYLGGPYRDPYYVARREKTFLITQTCNEALNSCFCNWTETDLTQGYVSDILFTLTKKGVVFEALTEKGKELLELANFAQASAEEIEEMTKCHAKAHKTLPPKPDLSKLPQILDFNFTNHDLWREVTAGCIGCNSCTYVCPTCQCFTITDEGTPLAGKRIRSWASCMTDEFTKEASGHNPRSAGFTRWRNRLGHKFNYMLTMHNGLKSCTGCGRCLLSCPASISIASMIKHILEKTPADANLPDAKIPSAKHEESTPQTKCEPVKSVSSPVVEKSVVSETSPVVEKPVVSETSPIVEKSTDETPVNTAEVENRDNVNSVEEAKSIQNEAVENSAVKNTPPSAHNNKNKNKNKKKKR